jgi:hypothetical protein
VRFRPDLLMAFRISNVDLNRYMQSLGHAVHSQTTRLVGIKGAVPYVADPLGQQISLSDDKLDGWNDAIGVWGSQWALFAGTVDPGEYWTEHPLNAKGAAHLLSLERGGQPWRFVWGLHHGEYECLVQGENFTVIRDRDRDGEADEAEPLDTGQFGIHIHHGGGGPQVGKWSAGCQVLKGGAEPFSQWRKFYQLLKNSGQRDFLYYLVDGRELAKFLGVL